MQYKLKRFLALLTGYVEIALGIMILIVCVIAGIGIIVSTDLSNLLLQPDRLRNLLSTISMIIIGIELIAMITSHTIGSVVDLMTLAVARQMLVDHTPPLETLCIVIAVAILFAIRKYLYISKIDSRSHSFKHTQSSQHTDHSS